MGTPRSGFTMDGLQFLLVLFGFLTVLQSFETKNLKHERRIRSFGGCKPGEMIRENSCVVSKCSPTGKPMKVYECRCAKMVGDKCACVDHTNSPQSFGSKFINNFAGESFHCGCDAGSSGYCKSGCVDHTGRIFAKGQSYDFTGNNGKFNCQCKDGKASCS